MQVIHTHTISLFLPLSPSLSLSYPLHHISYNTQCHCYYLIFDRILWFIALYTVKIVRAIVRDWFSFFVVVFILDSTYPCSRYMHLCKQLTFYFDYYFPAYLFLTVEITWNMIRWAITAYNATQLDDNINIAFINQSAHLRISLVITGKGITSGK